MNSKYEAPRFDKRVKELVAFFAEAFPAREDKLGVQDLEGYRYVFPLWEKLFTYYDIVQAYATDPILPMLAGKRPYIAYEHGTLRDFTLGDNSVCRNTCLSYHLADHVFITNGDCLDYAKRISVNHYSAMIHPIQTERIRGMRGDYERLHQEMRTTYVFLCTLRHDWEIKGVDKYIRALPQLAREWGSDFRVIMTSWGKEVDKSRNLAYELGVSGLIHWTAPFPRIRLEQMLKSVDILFDQIALPHFGATAPEGIAAEVPVVMSYDPSSTAWIIPEPAPILPAWTIEDIVKCVKIGLDPLWRKDYARRAREWIDTYHSSNKMVQDHLLAYQKVMSI
jgi:glycosyltransferase involved in cell wall biosynthesis